MIDQVANSIVYVAVTLGTMAQCLKGIRDNHLIIDDEYDEEDEDDDDGGVLVEV